MEMKRRLQKGFRKTFVLTITVIIAIVVISGTMERSVIAAEFVAYTSENISYNGKNFAIQVITVDLMDPFLPVMSDAAVNGTFFNA